MKRPGGVARCDLSFANRHFSDNWPGPRPLRAAQKKAQRRVLRRIVLGPQDLHAWIQVGCSRLKGESQPPVTCMMPVRVVLCGECRMTTSRNLLVNIFPNTVCNASLLLVNSNECALFHL